MKNFLITFFFIGLIGTVHLLSSLLCGPASIAAGSSKPELNQPSTQSPAITTPTPSRKVQLKPVGTLPFRFSNQSIIDLSADLDSMLLTAATNANTVLPYDPASPQLCDTQIELRSAVTTLELNIAEFGITVGYSPSGEHTPITRLTGKLNTKIGAIAMDFSLWECSTRPNGKECVAIAATTADHLTSNVQLSLEIDFDVIKTGPSLVYNTPLGSALRKIMVNGMNQLVKSTKFNKLAWKAFVREYIKDKGTLIFDAGQKEGINNNQSFVIYSIHPSEGLCLLYQPIAYIHTIKVDTLSSIAIIDQLLNSRGIKEGDLVLIQYTLNSQK